VTKFILSGLRATRTATK